MFLAATYPTMRKASTIMSSSIAEDDLDMDSLSELELDSLDTKQSSTISFTDKKNVVIETIRTTVNENSLNLDGILKNYKNSEDNDRGICYGEDIILADPTIRSLNGLIEISLRSNELHLLPMCILKLTSLIILDLTDNNLLSVPPEIKQLVDLQQLILDQNKLSTLPPTLWDLKFLRDLSVAHNRLVQPPDKPAEMKALILSDAEVKLENSKNNNDNSDANTLTNLNLRANRLKGNIILGNYCSLTELDVSENTIEHLDLTAVENLQVLLCSRNNLSQLVLYGKSLTSIIAGNNAIRQIKVRYPPTQLKHLDVSYNELEFLPEWLCDCKELRTLFSCNNSLKRLPGRLFCNEMPYLLMLQLAYNQLDSLPSPQRKLPVQELFLQNNKISQLPESFFKVFHNVRILNLSNNRLCELPQVEEDLPLEKLFLTANCLTDKSLAGLPRHSRSLKTLHAAYNNFTTIPDNCTLYWTEIEELVFSGNKILRLPESIGFLKHLTVLRVHSNLLQNIPKLCDLKSLRVLDLAHNQLDRIDLTYLIPPNLKFLDLSCNTKLHVDSQQLNSYRTRRPISLVDVSGKNRTSLPVSPSLVGESDPNDTCWNVGFSETSGAKQQLYVSQIRLPTFCNCEGLFGLFDSESNSSNIPVAIDKVVPRILLEERTVKETSADYMKYTLLSAHKVLKEKGQKHGINAIIIHILQSKLNSDYAHSGGLSKYIMRIASVGDARVVLGKAEGSIRILPTRQRKSLKTNHAMQLTVPDPDVTEIFMDERDEFMIIANKNLWEVISPEIAIKEVSMQRNAILGAKRLQDLAQSYGAEENISIIVVKFNLIASDVDLLMKELRQTIRKNRYQTDGSSLCQAGCCCEVLNNECANCIEKITVPHTLVHRDDRSSPSGQSENAGSDYNHAPARFYANHLNRSQRSITPHFESASMKTNPERRSYRGVARAVKARLEERALRNEESDSGLSEEQFKCWEYMLEQNTQLLFDKELNTLSRSQAQKLVPKNSTLSKSAPLLDEIGNVPSQNTFLSKQFGSSRSFNPATTRALSRLSIDKKLVGGPHAAYFGSLQRLMPYNLEYDFAVMQERGLADSLDLDRMQQYWGVTTTEL